jgi:hypothetical protein
MTYYGMGMTKLSLKCIHLQSVWCIADLSIHRSAAKGIYFASSVNYITLSCFYITIKNIKEATFVFAHLRKLKNQDYAILLPNFYIHRIIAPDFFN